MRSYQGKGCYLISYPTLPTNVITLLIEKRGEKKRERKKKGKRKKHTPDCYNTRVTIHFIFIGPQSSYTYLFPTYLLTYLT